MKAAGVSYFVVGATARDLLLTHVFGLPTERATRDIDIGMAVADWGEFQAVATRLVEEAKLVRDPKMVHRLQKNGYPLDIIPFRGVESSEQTVAWPPDLDVVMNVAGYEDAFHAALTLHIETGLAPRVVSLPGLAILKLFAWADRGLSDFRDAADLATLLRTYAEAGNHDRLYGIEMNAMEAVDFRLPLAGARLLGRDVSHVATGATRSRMTELLGDPGRRRRLAADMARAQRGVEDGSEEAEGYLKQFEIGLQGD